MAINKNEFITIINYFQRENDQDSVTSFLNAIGLSVDLSCFLTRDFWKRASLGGTIYQSLLTRKLLPDLSLKKVKVTYTVVEEDYTFTIKV